MNLVFGQELPEVVPNSPEATAFIKNGDTDVNLYTGVPNISIPIYTIQGKGINVPINLSYDTSGIKVDQIATWVGLGWNLNYGGVVTRRVNGLPDRSPNYYDITSSLVRGAYTVFEDGFSVEGGFNTSGKMSNVMQLIDNYEISNADIEADTFNFNINGLSGTIGIDYNTTILGKYRVFCLEDPTIIVDYTESLNKINQWIITDANGTKYTFGKVEITRSAYSSLENEYNNEYNSAWYITKIESSTSNDIINYNYTSGNFWTTPQPQFKNEVAEYKVDPCDNSYSPSPIITSNQNLGYSINQFDLNNIKHNGNIVVQIETSTTNRLDLSGKKSLKKVFIKNKNGNIIKEVEFVQDYFHSINPSPTTDELNHRLKLDELIIFPLNEESQIYSFDYFDENSLAPRNSGSRDYWGNYNGSVNTTMLAGNSDEFNYLRTETLNVTHSSGDRIPNFNFLKRGTLNKITYPTGGSTEFIYDIATSEPYIETFNPTDITNFQLIGGETPANALQIDAFYSESNVLCDDVNSGNNGIPKVLNHLITVDSFAANKNINLKSTISSINSSSNEYVEPLNPNPTAYSIYYIYKSNSPKSYCQLLSMVNSNDPDLLYYGNWTSKNFTFSQEAGNYYITLFSDKINEVIFWEYILPKANQQIIKFDNIGALRLKKTINRDNGTNAIIKEKYYYYNNLRDDFNLDLLDPNYNGPSSSDPNFNPISELKNFLDDGDYASSGVTHQKMLFNKIVKDTEMKTCFTNGKERLTTNKLQLHSYNLAPKARFDIAYSKVTEVVFSNNSFEGFTVYNFHNEDEGLFNQLAPVHNPNPLNGKLLSVSYYNHLNEIVKNEFHQYQKTIIENDIPYNGIVLVPQLVNIGLCRSLSTGGGVYSLTYQEPFGQSCVGNGQFGTYTEYFANRYRLYRTWQRLISTTSISYFKNQSNVESTVNYFYDNLQHYQTTQVKTINSKGETNTVKNYYPHDVEDINTLGYNNLTSSELTAIELLKTQHRIGTPIQTETILDNSMGVELSRNITRTNFSIWSNNLILPKNITTLKKGHYSLNTLDERITYYKYDYKGNPLELSKTNGPHTVYLWGYDKMYPVAMVENITYSQIEALSSFGVGFNIANELTTTQEDQLRGLSNTFVTTYKYDPLVGVTSMTDPKGYTMYYEYDDFNRLKQVKDAQGNILSKNEYHYKGQ